jgi:hypothetical protein
MLRTPNLQRFGPLLFLLLVSACSPATRSGTITSIGTDVLTRDEIMASGRSNAWDVLEFTRPLWLRERSDQSANRPGGIVVYVDESRFGGLDSLSSIPAREIYYIQRYTTTAASQRWGPGHSEGVIVISTRPVS